MKPLVVAETARVKAVPSQVTLVGFEPVILVTATTSVATDPVTV